MYEHCVRMKLLAQRFHRLEVTEEEFLCMKALVLFSICELAGIAFGVTAFNVASAREIRQERSRVVLQRIYWMNKVCELLWCSGFVVAVPVEGLKSQRCFDELRTSYIKELDRLASHRGETTRTQRLFQLTELLDYLQSVMHSSPFHNHNMFVNSILVIATDLCTFVQSIEGLSVPHKYTNCIWHTLGQLDYY